MVSVPNPLELAKGRVEVDSDEGEVPDATTFIGGRHGSPNVLVSFPLSRISINQTDPTLRDSVADLRGAVADLAGLVAAMAGALRKGKPEDEAQAHLESIQSRAAKLADLVPAGEPVAD